MAPTVSVRRPEKARQTTFAFNAPLARMVNLGKYARVGLDYDKETRTLTFIPTDEERLDGEGTFSLAPDGGSGKQKELDGRVAYVRASATEFVPVDEYPVRPLKAPRFAITLPKPAKKGGRS